MGKFNRLLYMVYFSFAKTALDKEIDKAKKNEDISDAKRQTKKVYSNINNEKANERWKINYMINKRYGYILKCRNRIDPMGRFLANMWDNCANLFIGMLGGFIGVLITLHMDGELSFEEYTKYLEDFNMITISFILFFSLLKLNTPTSKSAALKEQILLDYECKLLKSIVNSRKSSSSGIIQSQRKPNRFTKVNY